MPIGSTNEESTFGFGWVTLPRNDTSDGLIFERAQTIYFTGIRVWEKFCKLSEQAGGLLPPPIVDGLIEYSPLVTPVRASRWYALLFYLCGDAVRQQSGRVAGERELTIPTPHWDCVTAIQRCRLNTDAPCLPHHGAGEKLNQGQAAEAEERAPDKPSGEEHQFILEIPRWCDLAVGIDKDGRYLAVTPPPECGGIFPKESSVELDLPGKQWKELFDLLAQSEHGNTAGKAALTEAFGYVKKGDRTIEELDRLQHQSDMRNLLKTARSRLTGAIADLGRKLRRQVRGLASREGGPVLSVGDPGVVQAAFVTRYPVRGSDGKLRFGEPPTDG